VTLSTNASRETTSARNVFSGGIEKITSLGPYQKVRLNCGFPLVAYVTRHSLEKLLLKEGREIVAAFKATGIHVIRKTEL
jgi:tungstate transport system ATP-binding protein